MRRTILICAVLILFSRPRAAGGDWGDPLLTLRVEYRQDALDFDDVEKSFFRESARLGFGKSSAGITHIHIRESKENRFTGHLLIRGVSPHFEAVVGNYQLNFGTGLLVGRKKSITPDIFTRRLVLSREGIFSPADNGNPLFSFRGGAVAFTGGISGISISASGFFSSRYRYVKQDSRHPGIAPAGIPSILARTEGDHGHTEPAEILDYGALLSIMIGERLTAQSYYIRTVMRRAGNRRLLWNGSDGGGDGEFHGYGFYLQYRDGYITLFAELCFPRIIRQNATGHESRDRGRGLACGLIFHHPAFILSFSGKGTTGNYYSPHASGKPRGERAWAVDLTLRPAPRLSIGCGAFMEKMTAPTGHESHLPSIRREAVSIRYGVPGKGHISARLSSVETAKDRGVERSLNLKIAGAAYILRSLRFRLGGTGQRKGRGGISASIRGSLSLCLMNSVELQPGYSRFLIDRKNPLFAAASKRSGAISRGAYVRESSDQISLGLKARWGDAMISASLLHRFAGRRTIRSCLEFSGKILL